MLLYLLLASSLYFCLSSSPKLHNRTNWFTLNFFSHSFLLPIHNRSKLLLMPDASDATMQVLTANSRPRTVSSPHSTPHFSFSCFTYVYQGKSNGDEMHPCCATVWTSEPSLICPFTLTLHTFLSTEPDGISEVCRLHPHSGDKTTTSPDPPYHRP